MLQRPGQQEIMENQQQNLETLRSLTQAQATSVANFRQQNPQFVASGATNIAQFLVELRAEGGLNNADIQRIKAEVRIPLHRIKH